MEFTLMAQPRHELGKGASRRLRRQGAVPAIIYGAGKEPQPVTLNQNELLRNLQHEAFYSHLLTINLNGQLEKAVLKDLQRHPYRPTLVHVDLLRTSETEKLAIHIPLHFLNEEKCVGVKQGGGVVSRHLIEVEIRCLPKDLPEFIEIDLSQVQLNQIIHLSDLILPPDVEIVALSHGHGPEYNLPVASVHLPRAAQVEETIEAAATATATPVTPAA